ncbi:hypothetical protein OROMI_006190 [Orobanche minor]
MRNPRRRRMPGGKTKKMMLNRSEETVLALLRHPDYCISAYSSVDIKGNMEAGEKRFNQLSVEERGKFDEETLVNVNNIRKQSSTCLRASGFSNEYIVLSRQTQKCMPRKFTSEDGQSWDYIIYTIICHIANIDQNNSSCLESALPTVSLLLIYVLITILVAAEGEHKLPSTNNRNDLKEALQKLASIPSSRTLAVEVLWTPQNEDDTLSERELLEDYPLLRPL